MQELYVPSHLVMSEIKQSQQTQRCFKKEKFVVLTQHTVFKCHSF